MVVATTFLEALWVVMFAGLWIGVVAVVIMSVIDNFKRTDHSGGAKAAWMLFIVLFPLLGALVYMIARPSPAGTGSDWDSRRRDEAMLPR
jgi:Phospholipase_D-nuclease N-terminal